MNTGHDSLHVTRAKMREVLDTIVFMRSCLVRPQTLQESELRQLTASIRYLREKVSEPGLTRKRRRKR